MVAGRIGRHIETTLGSEGTLRSSSAARPKLRVITTSGGVTIRQR
jgi:hypothetical protein